VKQKFIEAGKIRNTHALRGEVKAECWLDEEKGFSALPFLYLSSQPGEKMKLQSVRRQGEVFLLSFEGVDTVEKAALLKGKTVYAAREDLDPEGKKIYFADLIGLPLSDAKSGKAFGKICEVTSRGAGELLVIRMENGEERYFPMVSAWIRRMDPEEGVFVEAPEGLFD